MKIERPDTLGTTIKIFLVDGTPTGLRTGEVINWTLRAIAAPRARLGALQSRREPNQPGVYILWGPDPDEPGRWLVYVGEGDPVWPRLVAHQAQKDFWTDLILVASTSDSLNKAHIQYLETSLIERIRNAGIARLENTQTPTLPTLSESDRSDAENLLDRIDLLIGALGLPIFRAPSRSADRGKKAPRFVLKGPDANAQGELRAEGFIVLRDSLARKEEVESIPKTYRLLRQRLLQEGKLEERGSQLAVAVDIEFTSPSAAAATMMGRGANGLIEWRTEKGVLLKDWQSEQLQHESNVETKDE